MGNFKISTGDKVSKQKINTLTNQAKGNKLEAQFNEFGYNFCEECLRSGGVRLSLSHIISVDLAQKTGRAELAWSVDNLKVLCIPCHQRFDKNDVRL